MEYVALLLLAYQQLSISLYQIHWFEFEFDVSFSLTTSKPGVGHRRSNNDCND